MSSCRKMIHLPLLPMPKPKYIPYILILQGSGFLFNKKGDIITNAHVAKDASYVFVTNEHGQEFEGQVIGISKKTDVALIRVPDLAGKDPLVQIQLLQK